MLVFVLLTLDAQSIVPIPLEPATTVFVDPANIVDPTLTPPHEFTIEVKIQNVTSLYGLDIQMSWNASILNYTDHTMKIPVEDYPDGVLHKPGLLIKNEVDKEAGTYWVSYASMSPAEVFNGSGIVFNMTFRVIGIGCCYLDIYRSYLSDKNGDPIGHQTEDGYFDNTFYDVAIIDVKPSTSYAYPGQTINISVTVKNNGTVRDEAFNVSTYWGNYKIDIRDIALAVGTEETLIITWAIPPELEGYEMVWANATIVEGDANPENNKFEDGMLRIAVGVHDVAIKDVTIPKNAIGQGQSMNITVLVSNQGTFPETVNLTLYLGNMVIGAHATPVPPEMDTSINMSIKPPPELDPGNWYVNYTIRVEVSPVPGEEDLEDNTFIDGLIMITIPGDVDADKDVDIYDVVKITCFYWCELGDPCYKPNSDINGDGIIDIYDVVICTSHYGQTYP